MTPDKLEYQNFVRVIFHFEIFVFSSCAIRSTQIHVKTPSKMFISSIDVKGVGLRAL